MKLVRLKIAGYRSLVDVDVAVRPLTVLIGPNGSGKTSLLDVLSLLQVSIRSSLASALVQQGGLRAVLSRTRPPIASLNLEFDLLDTRNVTWIYSIQLTAGPLTYSIDTETLERVGGDEKSGELPPLPQPLVRSRTKRLRPNSEELWLAEAFDAPEIQSIREFFTQASRYAPLAVAPRSDARLPQILTPTAIPTPGGETLFSVLYTLREQHHEAYQRVLDVLRLTFPNFQRLEFPIVGAGQVNLAWHQEDLAGPLYSNELSDGTLRFLWLATILLTPEPPPIILIDEPESSLHPQMLLVLAELMQDAALRTTVIVATHAPELIRWLKPDEVLVLDKEDGRTRATWADQMDLDAWLREYTLSDLWLMGNLGGRS